ncbi:MAG: hypothetical protein J6Z08_07360 [Elusimicrobiales bacterium]|nr:hypothetical protein [Elusimicrobiales bacterium]
MKDKNTEKKVDKNEEQIKICPKCGTEYKKTEYYYCPKDGGELYVLSQYCRFCHTDLSTVQGYSSIKYCPHCGRELNEKQKEIIKIDKNGEKNKLKRICRNSRCRKVYNEDFEYCVKCGKPTLLMQCSCGEIFRQNEVSQKNVSIDESKLTPAALEALHSFYDDQEKDVIFDKYCPKCGKINPVGQENQQITEKRNKLAQKLEEERQKDVESVFKKFETIEFGSYPYEADGTERAIEWVVLEKYSDGTALILSKYVLEALWYNNDKSVWGINTEIAKLLYKTDISITWENSTIRIWLNTYFYNKAFNNDEKELILESTVEEDKYSIPPFFELGEIEDSKNKKTKECITKTNDKIFLLSTDEARNYFRLNKMIIAYPTPYAKTNKTVSGTEVFTSSSNNNSCWWWLRSPGSVIDRDGETGLNSITSSNVGVRPVLKINLDKFKQKK